MSNLRVRKTNENCDEELRQQLKGDIKDIDDTILKLKVKKAVLEKDLLELDLKPFKIGDYALATIPSGRSTKEQKCLLECENGILYLRPIKGNGYPSGRHFSLMPRKGSKYSEYLKEVK